MGHATRLLIESLMTTRVELVTAHGIRVIPRANAAVKLCGTCSRTGRLHHHVRRLCFNLNCHCRYDSDASVACIGRKYGYSCGRHFHQLRSATCDG